MATAGAGEDVAAASAAAVLPIAGHGRVLVFAFGHLSGGIPPAWAAGDDQTGVSLLSDLSVKTATGIAERIDATARDGDRIVVSVHWGGNWGYEVPARHREFAHALIDEAGVDVVHGHSSHHPKAVEVYRGRPILYGCGDLLNDYEGIEGHETYRGDLTLMYFLRVSPSGGLVSFELVPLRIERFQLRRAAAAEARWLTDRLDRECRRFGGGVALNEDRALTLEW
jgi:poly-gamma-glutamate synthesis protein (capsule biosynthesis protein)